MIIRNHRRVNASSEHPTPRGRKCTVYRVDNFWMLFNMIIIIIIVIATNFLSVS